MRKLNRAEAHINALEDSIQRWLKTNAYTLTEHFEPASGEYILKAKVTKPPPDDWPLMVGDAVHNLRSTLDHIAYTLALSGYQSQHPGGSIPLHHQRRIQFPIVAVSNLPGKTAEQYYAQVVTGQLRYVDSIAASAIEALQPHKRAPADPLIDPLWLVNELDVIDKHRKLHPTAIASPLAGFQIGGGDVHIENMEINGGPVEGERVVVRLKMRAIGPTPVHLQRQITRYVALTDAPRGTTGEVVTMLRALSDNVTTTVVTALTPFL